MKAKVVAVKGVCNAGHEVGDTFPLSCRYPGPLCGYFFHDLFPRISVLQHGGCYPWWREGQTEFEYHCPDRVNQVSLVIEVQEEDEV
ncbi:TIGR04076 family protein [Desulfoferula mesophila]|uniref:TIGR04076 family protein n=1 Tax=Desulfoferula mesophila TaxID=3058419 RepID=A0AAU9ELY6_9BACT|nr:hypothetical protein FAK_39760 [Desulfoferula mesophilus]